MGERTAHRLPEYQARVALCASGELWGGVEQFVDSLARYLMSIGVPVVVLTLFEGPLRDRLEQSGVPVVALAGAGRYDPRIVFRMLAALRAHRSNIVHTHGYKASILGALVAGAAHAKLIRTEHGRTEPAGTIERVKMALNAWLEAVTSRIAADAVVFVSRDVQTHSRSAGPGTRQLVIYNGTDPRVAPPPSQVIDGFEDAAQVFTIGIVGRIAQVKGHAFLLEAMALLRQLPIRLYVIGEGPLEGQCRQFVAAHNLTESVRFMGFRRDAQDCISRLDALIMPSLHEGLPYALLEAMYYGVPIVASEVGGLAEVLEQGVTAVLVPPGRPAELAAAIERLHRDAVLRGGLARNARRLASERFLVESMARQYLDLYEKLLAN